MGLHRAGFEVVGVDIEAQPRYPFEFIQADALTYPIEGFDFVWASPVCKAYATIGQHWGRKHPEQIEATRERLTATRLPYIIENVNGAPLVNAVKLCGAQFGLKVYRHRFFESNILLLSPPHSPHRDKTPKAGSGLISPKGFISIAGHFSNVEYAGRAMGIDWMSQATLSQAIPPAYSEFLGRQVIEYLKASAVGRG